MPIIRSRLRTLEEIINTFGKLLNNAQNRIAILTNAKLRDTCIINDFNFQTTEQSSKFMKGLFVVIFMQTDRIAIIIEEKVSTIFLLKIK